MHPGAAQRLARGVSAKQQQALAKHPPLTGRAVFENSALRRKAFYADAQTLIFKAEVREALAWLKSAGLSARSTVARTSQSANLICIRRAFAMGVCSRVWRGLRISTEARQAGRTVLRHQRPSVVKFFAPWRLPLARQRSCVKTRSRVSYSSRFRLK